MKKLAALLLTLVMMLSFSTVAMAAVSPSGDPHEDEKTEVTSPATGMDASVIYLGATTVILGGVAVTAAKKLEA